MSTEIAHCGSCNAPIYWLKHPITGKPAPIEVTTSETGNIVVNLTQRTYQIVPAHERPLHTGYLHDTHFTNCPQAKAYREEVRGNRRATRTSERPERGTP